MNNNDNNAAPRVTLTSGRYMTREKADRIAAARAAVNAAYPCPFAILLDEAAK